MTLLTSIFGPNKKQDKETLILILETLVLLLQAQIKGESDNEQRKAEIMAKLSELAGILGNVGTQLGKAKTEILAKLEILAGGDRDLTPEQEDALASLKSIAQALDDIVPDAPTPTP